MCPHYAYRIRIILGLKSPHGTFETAPLAYGVAAPDGFSNWMAFQS